MQLHKQKIFSSLAAVDTYDMILNHALLMGGEEIRGTHIAPLGHVAVYHRQLLVACISPPRFACIAPRAPLA